MANPDEIRRDRERELFQIGGQRRRSGSPVSDAFERAKESAAQMIAGRESLAARGTQARLSSQGIQGIPGIQTAVSTPHRARATEQLASVSAKLDIARDEALSRERRLAFARNQLKNEKDEARRARWTLIIAKLTAAGIGFALSGGSPAGAVAGYQVGGAIGGQPEDVPTSFGGQQYSNEPFPFYT